MAYTVELFSAAEDDLDEAMDWYAGESIPTAHRFLDTYLNLLDRLSNNPFQFPKAKGEVRKARFSPPFPYAAHYFIHDDAVFIVSVLHDKRNPKIWQSRI